MEEAQPRATEETEVHLSTAEAEVLAVPTLLEVLREHHNLVAMEELVVLVMLWEVQDLNPVAVAVAEDMMEGEVQQEAMVVPEKW